MHCREVLVQAHLGQQNVTWSLFLSRPFLTIYYFLGLFLEVNVEWNLLFGCEVEESLDVVKRNCPGGMSSHSDLNSRMTLIFTKMVQVIDEVFVGRDESLLDWMDWRVIESSSFVESLKKNYSDSGVNGSLDHGLVEVESAICILIRAHFPFKTNFCSE